MRTVCHNFASSAGNGMMYVHTQRVCFPPHWVGLGPSVPSHPALFLSEALILLSDSCLAPVGTALYFSLHPLAKVIDPEDHWSNHNMWNFTKVVRLANHLTLAGLFHKIYLQVYGEVNETLPCPPFWIRMILRLAGNNREQGKWDQSHEDYRRYKMIVLCQPLSLDFHNTFSLFILSTFSSVYYYSS